MNKTTAKPRRPGTQYDKSQPPRRPIQINLPMELTDWLDDRWPTIGMRSRNALIKAILNDYRETVRASERGKEA